MMLKSWATDTIARRFALTVVFTAAVTVVLVYGLTAIAGSWALEPIGTSGLLQEAADMVSMIEATPPELRARLAPAAHSSGQRTYWFPADSEVARVLPHIRQREVGTAQRVVSKLTQLQVVVPELDSGQSPLPALLDPRHPDTVQHALAVRLHDRSWVVFAFPQRRWGLNTTWRWIICSVFLGIAITLVTTVAARRFARPIKQLAVAVREFGLNPRSPPIAEDGPRELRQVIRTFNEMQTQIQKVVTQRTMMLAAISHDLRTPLTRMRLRGELIEDPQQQARHFRDVDEMQQMVDGALAFFADDSISEPNTPFDLPQVLLTIANDYADQKIDISYDGPTHTLYYGRPFALKRAFDNLVQNAIKYGTPPELVLRQEPQAITVLIRDRGPGIPEKWLEAVFDPYYRLEKSRNRNTGGVGLGLTVALSIVQSHGGHISLHNRTEGGLEARVRLPIVREPATA